MQPGPSGRVFSLSVGRDSKHEPPVGDHPSNHTNTRPTRAHGATQARTQRQRRRHALQARQQRHSSTQEKGGPSMAKPRRRRYTDADRASALAALDANEGNLSKTSRNLGIAVSTLQRWIKDRAADLSDLRKEKKADLADKLEHVAHKLVDAMPEKLSEATLQQVATSLGITIDKLRLLREESTAIEEVRTSDAKQRLVDRLKKLHESPPEADSS